MRMLTEQVQVPEWTPVLKRLAEQLAASKSRTNCLTRTQQVQLESQAEEQCRQSGQELVLAPTGPGREHRRARH